MEYGQKADVWSAGILCYQLLTGRLPFIGDNGLMVSKLYMTKQIFSNKDVFRAILYADLDFKGPPWDELSAGAAALVCSLLTRDPAARPTAHDALANPWFAEMLDGEGTGNGSNGAGGSLLDTVVQRLQRFGTYGRLKQVRWVARCVLRWHAACSGALRPPCTPGALARGAEGHLCVYFGRGLGRVLHAIVSPGCGHRRLVLPLAGSLLACGFVCV